LESDQRIYILYVLLTSLHHVCRVIADNSLRLTPETLANLIADEFVLLLLEALMFDLRLVRRNGTFSADDFSRSALLDKIDILVPNTKLVLEIYAWLSCKGHSRAKQSFVISFVEVR
jgi:hypothetical protein